jgi:hypothetical protein
MKTEHHCCPRHTRRPCPAPAVALRRVCRPIPSVCHIPARLRTARFELPAHDSSVTIVCACLSSVFTRFRRNVSSRLPSPDSHSRQSGDHRLCVSFLGAYSPSPKRWLVSSVSGLSLANSLQLSLFSHPCVPKYFRRSDRSSTRDKATSTVATSVCARLLSVHHNSRRNACHQGPRCKLTHTSGAVDKYSNRAKELASCHRNGRSLAQSPSSRA